MDERGLKYDIEVEIFFLHAGKLDSPRSDCRLVGRIGDVSTYQR